MIELLKHYKIINDKNKINNNAKKIVEKNPLIANKILEQTKNIIGDLQDTLRERLFCIINNINEIPRCLNCGEQVKFNHSTNNYQKYCCLKCANSHDIKKHKTRMTNFEKYGGAAPLCNENVKQKMIETNIRSFGQQYHQQTEYGKQQRKQTIKQKYQCNHIFESTLIQEKIHQTMIEKYGTKYFSQKHISLQSLQQLNDRQWLYQQHIQLQKPIYQIAEQLNVSTFCVRSYLKKHNIPILRFFASNVQKQVLDFLKFETKISNIVINDRQLLFPQEIDILIPEQRFAIEVNGIFWHSENKGKYKTYHLEKALNCKQKGYTLFQFTDQQWFFQNQTIKNILKNKLGKNQYEQIDFNQCEVFLNCNDQVKFKTYFLANSLKQYIKPDLCYQLIYKQQIVILLLLKKINSHSWELIDFIENNQFNVHQGIKKLFDIFIKNYKPKTVIYVLNNNLFDVNILNELNFKFSGFSQPNCFYFNKNYPYILFSENQLSQHEKHTYERYWDCGNSIWIWENVFSC